MSLSSVPYKELLTALLGASVGLLLMRLEDKFYNKQYTTGDYIKLGTGFYVACLAVVFANRYISQLPVFLPAGPIPVNLSSTVLPGDSRSVFTPINSVNNLKFQGGVPNF
jgi:hypothetical protein